MFRRLIVLAGVALLACALAAPALALRVKVRVEGKTTTIFGSAEPTLTTGTNALAALDTASISGEFYYHVRADTVLWYWSTFNEQGGSPTLLLRKRKARNCYTVVSQNDQGVSTPAAGARLLVDGRSVKTKAGRGCVGKHRGLVRATLPNAVRSNALR